MGLLIPNLKLLLSFLLFAVRSIPQIDCVSVINNQVLPSDIIQQRFFDEVRLGSNISDIIGADIGNSGKCISQMRQIINQLPNLNAAKFIDSWGKFPSGILYGHLMDIGNYDECVDASLPIENSDETINGQFCFASIPLSSGSLVQTEDLALFRQSMLDPKADLPVSTKISLGICMPDTCESNLMSKFLERIIGNLFNTSVTGVTVSRCSVAERSKFDSLDVFAIVLFSLFGLFLLLSTLYDCYIRYYEVKPVKLFLAFSILTNAKNIFFINTKKSANSIDCLHGIRVLSMVWIVYCHNYVFFETYNMINVVDFTTLLDSATSMIVLMASVSVDTFLFMSGILLAWLGFRDLDKTKGKMNVIMMYVHRYIRLTPPLAALILFNITLIKHIGSGPFTDFYKSMNEYCRQSWWSTLLYVQNYVSSSSMCISQSWYLAVDTQLYFLSPIILIPLWKWGKKCAPFMIILSLLSMGCVFTTYFVEGFVNLRGFIEPGFTEKVYIPTHTRYPVWLGGIGFGYILHLNKGKSIRPSMLVQIVGWVVSLGIIFSIIFAPYNTHETGYAASVGEAATYESLKRVSWAVALAWIVFSSYFGFGGVISSFLSHPIWQPLSRLTYSFYLIHIMVLSFNFGTLRTSVYFSTYDQLLRFWTSFGMSFIVAVIVSLSFEAPLVVIEKVLFSSKKKKTEELPSPTVSAPASIEVIKS